MGKFTCILLGQRSPTPHSLPVPLRPFCTPQPVFFFFFSLALVFMMPSFWCLYFSSWLLSFGFPGLFLLLFPDRLFLLLFPDLFLLLFPDCLFLLLFPRLFQILMLCFTLCFGNPPGPLGFHHLVLVGNSQMLVCFLNSLLRSRPEFLSVYWSSHSLCPVS